jgi:hypothetical protein
MLCELMKRLLFVVLRLGARVSHLGLTVTDWSGYASSTPEPSIS